MQKKSFRRGQQKVTAATTERVTGVRLSQCTVTSFVTPDLGCVGALGQLKGDVLIQPSPRS